MSAAFPLAVIIGPPLFLCAVAFVASVRAAIRAELRHRRRTARCAP